LPLLARADFYQRKLPSADARAELHAAAEPHLYAGSNSDVIAVYVAREYWVRAFAVFAQTISQPC
jgi:hypothetical protein